jgi:outer membrane protein
MLKKIVLFAFLLIPLGAIAQDKIAYLNSEEVITAMPEYAQLQDSLQNTQKAFEAYLAEMQDEYSKKYQAFMKEGDMLNEAIRIRRLQEVQEIEQKAANFAEESKERLQQLYAALMTPIEQKVRNAIQAVGAENNFTYVLNAGVMMYVSPTATNATDLVKKKLGL